MKAYYGYTTKGREFFYIPFNLVGYFYKGKIFLRWEPKVLNGLALLLNNISEETLEDRGWNIEEENVPNHLLKEFQDLCWRNADYEEIRTKAFEIYDWVWSGPHISEFQD